MNSFSNITNVSNTNMNSLSSFSNDNKGFGFGLISSENNSLNFSSSVVKVDDDPFAEL